MSLQMKTSRVCAGEYTRTYAGRSVRVFYHATCRGWMAAAEWDAGLYTDILGTKKDAIRNANHMLVEAYNEKGELKWN